MKYIYCGTCNIQHYQQGYISATCVARSTLHLGEQVELYALQFGLGKEGEPNAWCSVLVVQVSYVLPGNVPSIVLDKSGDYHFMIHCTCALRHTSHWRTQLSKSDLAFDAMQFLVVFIRWVGSEEKRRGWGSCRQDQLLCQCNLS